MSLLESKRVIAVDDRAFREIYDRHAPPVYRFLRDLLRDDAAADEATQETFVRAHRGLATMRDASRISAWLFGIARNVFYETLRQRKTRGQLTDVELDEEVDPGPSPESQLLGREADEVLAQALACLAPGRRAALLMAMDHGLAYAEIAEAMGWSLAKVKVEIHRARQMLRARVEEYLAQDQPRELGGKS